MKRTIQGLAEAGDQLIQQAIDATRKYHEAKDMGAPAAEVARLKLLADSLYQAVTEFQLKSRGETGDTHH
ncbi:hypothetical protein NP522_19840 [Pseudomonas guariconensis]|uniref:hypothetical protein n=1 Tax=Pseudomonas guariconensis TaxID=1288410 RepID=UPI0023636CBC|nr:hypothetical protein [Pseudomonas guariconensis]MDD2092439.1 hypothetical protein [Pseudomonas guariconensis]